MKTFYLATLLLTSCIAVTAQTQKGTININGQFGSNRGGDGQVSSGNLVRTFSLQLSPNVGYFIKNNWEIGGGVALSTSQSRYREIFPNNPEKYSSNNIGLQIYSKYYFGKGAVKPYITAGTRYNWFANNTYYVDANTVTYKTNYWSANAGVGVAWFASSRVALFSQLTYDRNWNGYTYSSKTMNLNFGVQVNLGKK
ncbi:autotransporter outer membrane beta-barrel domain-containing protein [Lacibacter sp. H407]|uniref:autotransporter outer membrane beta-barrel domain-containing protein n=1 Tax=Lacibacter sp. H407 TaxID=3133423 RepID=UPI0030BAB58E